LKDWGHKIVLHIIGDGTERVNLEKLAKALGLDKEVFFWGYKQKEELPLFYSIADVFVFPSLYDIWGLVLVEAMACGLPVICSNLAGVAKDVVQNGLNGFVVAPTDYTKMAKYISLLLGDKALQLKMGRKSKEIIRTKINLEKSAEGFQKAIEHVFSF